MDVILMKNVFTFDDPPKNWAFALAKKLERGNPLDTQIVIRLLGRPHRFSELQPLLVGRGKNNLTQALKRLQLDAIIQMRTNLRVTPPSDTYELTFIGVRAALALASREYLERALEAGAAAPPTAADS